MTYCNWGSGGRCMDLELTTEEVCGELEELAYALGWNTSKLVRTVLEPEGGELRGTIAYSQAHSALWLLGAFPEPGVVNLGLLLRLGLL